MPIKRQSFIRGGMAPDFELSDREGNPVRLSDFRGKKVLLLTWASW
jgi:peroxiredoxin